MARHCVSVRLADGTTINLQFSHMPTEAEIERAKVGLERDVAALKAGKFPPAKEDRYPD
jgi:hypothetical protein